MKITTVEQMRELDRRAVGEHRIPELVLMENAGLGAVEALARELAPAPVAGRRVVILCGPGNNGGDGFVVARQLHARGARVRVSILADPERYGGAAADNLRALRTLDVPCATPRDGTRVAEQLAAADLAVDALLGTGLTRDVGGLLAEAVEALNRWDGPVLSLDIPSGIQGDTGAVRGVAVQARATVTFGLPKRGNLLYPGAGHGGRLYVTRISFPPELIDACPAATSVLRPSELPRRPEHGHKGSFGVGLTVAGAAAYYGAPAFAAEAFLRAGGGYSRLAAPEVVCRTVATRVPELVFHPQPAGAAGAMGPEARAGILELADRADAVVLGPGLSLEDGAQRLVRDLVAGVRAAVVVDGDGLTALAGDPACLEGRKGPTVLTPHPGEMARLVGCTVPELLADPVPRLQAACRDLGCAIVLKGAHSLVGDPDGSVRINLTGNDGLATAGSGDVLSGTIASLLARGLGATEAAATGVFLHGLAGDLAAEAIGADGMTARDVLEWLPEAVRSLREEPATTLDRVFEGLVEL